MVIAFDAATDGDAGTGTTATLAHTCTGSNLVLLVGVSIALNAGNVSSFTVSCTYNSVSMTEVRSGTSTGVPLQTTSLTAGSCLFRLFAPATGVNNIVVTVSNTVNVIALGAVSYTGVDVVENVTTATSNGATDSPGLVVTSGTGDLVFAHAAHGDVISGVGSGTTQRYLRNVNGLSAGGNIVGGDEPGAASVTIDFTSAINDHWVMIGVNLAPLATAVPGLWNSGIRRG